MIDILKAIPHREPFLLIDKIVELKGDCIVAIKRLNPEMDVLKGHYPDFPIMPGVLICEAIFQAAAVLLSWKIGGNQMGLPLVTRIKDAKFKKMIMPTDEISLEAELTDQVGPAFYMKGKAKVNGETAASVLFTCKLPNKI